MLWYDISNMKTKMLADFSSAIICQHTLEKIQISLGKSLSNCEVLRQNSKVEIQMNLRRKTFHRTNQGSNFLGVNFSNKDNVRAKIKFRRKNQPSIFQFHSNSTSVISPFFLIGIHFMQGWTATVRHGDTRKRSA